MNLTSIFRLRKPEGTDPVNVEDFNDNFDVIDTELNKRPEKTGNASDMVTTFSQAASRANLTPGEKISVSFGKIMKFFADLKAVAFTGSYADLSNKPSIPGGAAASQAVANNCTTTAAGSVLDARQGKVLMDKANQINSDLAKVKVYVGSDGKLHFVNSGGADSVLPFSKSYTLPQMVFQIQDSGGSDDLSRFYLPLLGASKVSFTFWKNNYGSPTATINYADGSTQQVFSLGRGQTQQNYSVNLTKEALNIYFTLPYDSTVAHYVISNFSVT